MWKVTFLSYVEFDGHELHYETHYMYKSQFEAVKAMEFFTKQMQNCEEKTSVSICYEKREDTTAEAVDWKE